MKFVKKYLKYIFLFICMFTLLENASAAETSGFVNDIDQKYVICNGIDIPYGIPVIASRVVNLIKVGIPVVLIVLGMLDFLRAVISNDEKNMKSSTSSFLRRGGAAIVIFFVFAIVQFAFSLANEGAFGCVNCIINNECGTVETYDDSNTNDASNNTGNNTSDCGCEVYKQSGSICGWTTTQECVSTCKETTDIYKCEEGTSTCAMGSGKVSTIYTAKRCEQAGCEKYKTCTNSNN